MVGQELTREQAFAALAQLVQTYRAEGRVAKGASLKLALVRVTNGRFHEQRLQYPRFGDFLKDAERRGFVELRRPQPGADYDVYPVPPARVVSEGPTGEGTPSAGAGKIRQDLWTCFINWSPGWKRIFDRDRGAAYIFPLTESQYDSDEVRRNREAWQQNPDRFISIDPIEPEVQLGWMRDFVAAIPQPALRQELELVLSSGHPHRDFANAVRRLGLIQSWHSIRVDHVARIIEQWAQKHQLVIQATEGSPPPPRMPLVAVPSERSATRQDGAAAAVGTDDLEQLTRARLHSIIDRMPLAELLKIELPVGYIIFDR